jgi:hypothetical protein
MLGLKKMAERSFSSSVFTDQQAGYIITEDFNLKLSLRLRIATRIYHFQAARCQLFYIKYDEDRVNTEFRL